MLTRAQKEDQVVEFREKIGRATSVVLADFCGLGVQQVNDLRGRIRAGEYEYKVVKNAVLKRACADTDAGALAAHFNGPTAVAISYGDPAGLAKVLVDYAKENEAFEIKGGLLEGRAVDEGELATLATLPSLDELRGQLVGLLNAPATKLVRLLNEPAAQVARLVEARRAQLAEGAEGS